MRKRNRHPRARWAALVGAGVVLATFAVGSCDGPTEVPGPALDEGQECILVDGQLICKPSSLGPARDSLAAIIQF